MAKVLAKAFIITQFSYTSLIWFIVINCLNLQDTFSNLQFITYLVISAA